MSGIAIRDGKFDVVVAAAPGVEIWPSAGVRALTSICADMGLTVGLFGGDDLKVRGVIPLPGTGAVALVEDAQNRVHRIQARAVVKVSPLLDLPDPFPGWRSQGFVPLQTAIRLKRESIVQWDPCTVILGTGNRALRFGTELLQSGTAEVFCIETHGQWGAKRFAGWEVEKRRFEMAGGRVIEARPVKLTQKSAMFWEFRVQDSQGIRLIETTRVVSAGPFRQSLGVREHPAGSMLFELEQTAANTPFEDVEGWMMEEERGRWLGARVVRALATDLGPRRDDLDRIYRRARGRLRKFIQHQNEPFTPSYQGKWMTSVDSRKIREFSGTPQKQYKIKSMASVECLEDIACNLCQNICPTQAIAILPRPEAPERVLKEDQCTACGLCLTVCPSEAISMVEEKEGRSLSKLVLSWRGKQPWNEGEFALLLNRRGDVLGSARVKEVFPSEKDQLVHLEVPPHLLWEARGLRRPKSETAEDEAFFASVQRSASSESKVEVTLNGKKGLMRDQIPITTALFESGRNRPEDMLFCRDGSCGLCQVNLDGVKKLACRSQTHRGMALKIDDPKSVSEEQPLCPCLGITRAQVAERMKNGNLRSPEAVLSVTHVGEGECRGRLCMGPFLRALSEMGIETEGWVDWRFPWSEWVLGHN